MHRCYLPPEACQGTALELSGSEAHHALHVLRVRVGDPLWVLDGAGHSHRCVVKALGRHRVTLGVEERLFFPRQPHQITLIQAVAKPRSMDWVVQKATELGAHRLIPVLTERSIPHLDQADAARKAARWRDLAIEALKQCGTPWLPVIDPPRSLSEFLARVPRFDLTLVAALAGSPRHPREPWEGFFREHGRVPDNVAVWIGPEGDFTPAELEAVVAAGAVPITLGPYVLRCETAAVACLAILAYELAACAWDSRKSQATGST
ncbi:MAG: 16S rRNA (uracil(1498)-N(3))-methyltransferase [Verrucomicrobia bacterium]|nr:16S rRNA (uracil(1498)-N(3))-methyltransferase [Verrucomicrobiota bacterium]